MKKTFPYVMISPNEMNKFLLPIVVAPMTSSSKPYPTRVERKHDKKNGWIVLDQIRTIDRQRIIKVTLHLTEKNFKKLKILQKKTVVD